MKSIIAQVLVDAPKKVQDKTFSYWVPYELRELVQIGSLVVVRFGKLSCRGFVLGLTSNSPEELKAAYELKPIESVLALSVFDQTYLEFLEWVGKYYASDMLTVLKGVLPTGILSSLQERISLIEESTDHRSDQADLSSLEAALLQIIRGSASGSLSLVHLKKQKLKVKSWPKLLKALEAKSYIKREIIIKKSASKRPLLPSPSGLAAPRITLNTEQNEALRILSSHLPSPPSAPFLVQGVTGSGKTELYFKLMEEVLEAGKQVIYLVPEIALTLLTINRIRGYFQNHRTVVWHSDLSDGERLEAWQACLENEPLIVLGARSAVFAPTHKLGLIVIDEEHDSSYKSGARPFYDARKVATQRALLSGALVVRGSATPMIASYHQAANHKTLLYLTERYHKAKLPPVQIIDMRRELEASNKSIFSRLLKRGLDEVLGRSEQAILFHNRRGHSPSILCLGCGYIVFCPDCHAPMIYHLADRLMHCHHCDRRSPLPTECPECQSHQIKRLGLGTQKLEEELKKLYPEIEILRIDRDVTKSELGIIWNKLSDGHRPQILLGTQLVAKGIDLPRVTLVGVMQAEASLFFPDYLASERTFQLLTQAAGRAGRHQAPGKVIFQTYVPDHPVIKLAAQQDYQSFYESEIDERKIYKYPPFCEMARLLLSHEEPAQVEKDARQVYEQLKFLEPKIKILGPSPCPLTKLSGLHRWHLLLKLSQLNLIRHWQSEVLANLKIKSRLSLDLNPINLM